MKVAIDVGPLYGHRTGVGVATGGLTVALDDRDDVETIGYLTSFRSSPRPGHRRLPVPGAVASHVWARGDWPSADRWLSDADVVHGTNYVVPPTSRPSVISVYDTWFLTSPERTSAIVRRAAARVRRSVANGAWVHTSSHATEANVRDILATDRVATVHLGRPPITPPLSELPRPEVADRIGGRPFVLAIGTLERRKDVPALIRAFRRVGGEAPGTQLVLAGQPGDAGAEIESELAALGRLRDDVHVLGAVDDPVKHWLLRQAAVLAYPSIDEGFGFPILEAQAAGTPVVARRVGSIPEIGGDGIRLVELDDDELAGALVETLIDGGRRLSMIESGHRNVQRFDWGRAAEQLVELYTTAIDQHR